MDSDMASNGSRVTVTWIVFEDRLLKEVGLTQNQETTALRTLTTVDFILCYHA